MTTLRVVDSELGAANDVSNKEESFLEKIQAKFGDEIKTAFEREEIIDNAAIKDLAHREPDAPIFLRLGMTYGKATKFRKEFGGHVHVQPLQSRTSPPIKPSMASIANFTPEMRRLYLAKRKKIGLLATEKWGKKFPKFNSPQMKAELNEFSAKIAPDCSIPEVGFTEEGIAKHVQDFCNEQRRYEKLKNSKSLSCKGSEEDQPRKKKTEKKSGCCDDSEEDQPTKKKRKQKVDENNNNDSDSDHDQFSDTPSTLSLSSESLDDHKESSSADDKMFSYQLSKDATCLDQRLDTTYNLKVCQMIFKAVFGKVQVDREDIVKILKKKFAVKQDMITSLTISQLMEVTAKKLVNKNYCSIKGGPEANMASLKIGDITVHTKIAL